MNKKELQTIPENHKQWPEGDSGGKYDLSNRDLRGCNLSNSNLSNSDLRGSNLSGCLGLLNPIDWMQENLEKVSEGYIAYKTFDMNYQHPKYWKIKAGSEISEVVNPLPTLDCACGVNVAIKDWFIDRDTSPKWKVLIKWEWLPSVVVPYNTDGKFRCGRVQLLEEVTDVKEDVR